MDYVCCNLCGASTSVSLFERVDRFSGELFRYVQCPACGLIYLNPRPSASELLAYYPDDYEAYQPLDKSTPIIRWKRRGALSTLRQFVTNYQQYGRLLDIGCATGEFLKEMQAHGWQVQGIEIDSQAAIMARESYDVKVFTGSIADFQTPERFDIITLWDVLEHLPYPKASLYRIHSILDDDGYLIFSIPNLRSFDVQVFGRWWIGWDAPRHLYLFPRATLKELLNETGFEIRECRCLLGETGAFQLSWRFWLEQRFHSRLAWSRFADILDQCLPYLIWPYKKLSYALDRGSVLTVAVRKDTST